MKLKHTWKLTACLLHTIIMPEFSLIMNECEQKSTLKLVLAIYLLSNLCFSR